MLQLEKHYNQTYKGFDPKNPETLRGLKILQEDYLDKSINMAAKIENNCRNKLYRKLRGIKKTALWVLDAAYMPSVLIECVFYLITKKDFISIEKTDKTIWHQLFHQLLLFTKRNILEHNPMEF